MSWLRLPDFDAGDPELVHDDSGELVEVEIYSNGVNVALASKGATVSSTSRRRPGGL